MRSMLTLCIFLVACEGSSKNKSTPTVASNNAIQPSIHSLDSVKNKSLSEKYDLLFNDQIQDDVNLLEAFMDASLSVANDEKLYNHSFILEDNVYSAELKEKILLPVSSSLYLDYKMGFFYDGLGTIQHLAMKAFSRYPEYLFHKKGEREIEDDFEDFFKYWTGVKLFKYPEEGDSHLMVNVKALKHLQNILPKANSSWQKTTYQEIYNHGFQVLVHRLSMAYLYLHSDSQLFESETQKYIQLAQSEEKYSGQAIEYAKEQYNHLFKDEWREYREEDVFRTAEGLDFQPWQAITFWLRRHNDRSDLELWNILLGILNEYDSEWVKTLQIKYPNAKEIWNAPHDISGEKHILSPQHRGYLKINNVAAFFETVIDGYKVSGYHAQQALLVGPHQVTVLNCWDVPEEMKTQEKCYCLEEDIVIETGKQVVLKYDHENNNICDSISSQD